MYVGTYGSKLIEITKSASDYKSTLILSRDEPPPSNRYDDFEVLKLAENVYEQDGSNTEDQIPGPSPRKSKRAKVVDRKQATEQSKASQENTLAWREEATMLWVFKSSLSSAEAGDLALKDKSVIHESVKCEVSYNDTSEIEPVDENTQISAGPRSKRSRVTPNMSKNSEHSMVEARNQTPVVAPLQSKQPLGMKTPKDSQINSRFGVAASGHDASSTPTSLKNSAQRRLNVRSTLQSPASAKLLGLSPLFLKRNAKGETSLHLAAIKVSKNFS